MFDDDYMTHEELLKKLGLTQEDLDEVDFCEECGQPLVEHKEYVDGKQHLPVIYMVCPDCDKGGI